MSDTLPIPEWATDKDEKRIRHINRNRRIRRDYEPLKKEYGREKAAQKLADRERCSPSTVLKVVYNQR